MAGINVKHQVIQEFSDSYGNEIHEGDLCLLCIKKTEKTEKTENVLCVFKGTKGQYLVTSTVDHKFLNQYRLSSVNECQVVEGIRLKKVEDEE